MYTTYIYQYNMCQLYIIAFDGMTWEDIQIFDNKVVAKQLLEKIKSKCGNKYITYNFRIEIFGKHADRFLPTYESITE